MFSNQIYNKISVFSRLTGRDFYTTRFSSQQSGSFFRKKIFFPNISDKIAWQDHLIPRSLHYTNSNT